MFTSFVLNSRQHTVLCLPPGPLASLIIPSVFPMPYLCIIIVRGCGGPGRSLVYGRTIEFDSTCVLSRPICLLSRPSHCSKFRTPVISFNGLESIDFTVIIWVVIYHGFESTVKMGTFILQLTKKFRILHCTQVLRSGWVWYPYLASATPSSCDPLVFGPLSSCESSPLL